jgi:hypothetical protein
LQVPHGFASSSSRSAAIGTSVALVALAGNADLDAALGLEQDLVVALEDRALGIDQADAAERL